MAAITIAPANKPPIKTQTVENKIGDLVKAVTETVDYDLARQLAYQLTQDGVRWIIQIFQGYLINPKTKQFNQDYDALPIVSRLVEILAEPKLSQQKDIQDNLAKACRLFTECLALQIKCNEEDVGVISHQEKEKYLTVFLEKRRLFPEENVVIHYELKCAHAAANTLKSDQSIAGKYFEIFLPIVTSGAAQSWSEIVPSCIELFQQVFRDLPQQWFNDVVSLSWNTHFFLEKQEKSFAEALKILEANSKKYADSKYIAFYAVEAVSSMIPIFSSSEEHISILLNGSLEHEYPGLLVYIAVEKKRMENT